MTLEGNTGWQRTYNVLGNPIVRKKGGLQTKQTVWPDRNDYSYESGRQSIMMLEGFLCNNGTYNPLLEEINKDRIFNILKSGDTNDRFKALINRRSMIDSAKILTDRIINDERITKESPCSILAHSNGGVIGALVRIMLDQAGEGYKISNLTTLSSATDGSKAISELPVGWFYSSLKDMAPDSDAIKAIRKDGRIDTNLITTEDEVFSQEELKAGKGEKRFLKQGHMDGFIGAAGIIRATAEEVNEVMLTKSR